MNIKKRRRKSKDFHFSLIRERKRLVKWEKNLIDRETYIKEIESSFKECLWHGLYLGEECKLCQKN
jgi:hypothetical protein